MNGEAFSIKAPEEFSKKFAATLKGNSLTKGDVFRIFLLFLEDFLVPLQKSYRHPRCCDQWGSLRKGHNIQNIQNLKWALLKRPFAFLSRRVLPSCRQVLRGTRLTMRAALLGHPENFVFSLAVVWELREEPLLHPNRCPLHASPPSISWETPSKKCQRPWGGLAGW